MYGPYGPYVQSRGTGSPRRIILFVLTDGTKKTMAYARWLMIQELQRPLLPNETVDHIDEDATNDKVENFQILSLAENVRKSSLGRPSPFKGTEKGWTHGTVNGFQKKKCKCQLCSEAKIPWEQERNKRRRAGAKRGPYRERGQYEHGTTTMYKRGCRCEICRADNARKAREGRVRSK